ncbi:transcription factor IIIB 60 kDa subunit isoform X1 [Ziziphus jujuba]|uniref:Transcription factor IIIB 60 kDa subunit isoform X1 n=1 Tax=Ziziphus jujuba TaxID=326968 RepID=A0A6P4A111_ZIZJJ|nr:transcription factor IIIB 60 kDa subunit isoform X1 [Ziziphus jujuba]
MVWCGHCKCDRPTHRDENSYVCCGVCGKVIYDDCFTDEPTFVKGAGGESRLAGSFVRSIASGYSESLRRTLDKGSDEIRRIVLVLKISGGDSIVNPASAFYKIAVERNFTRGRRTTQVAAACLYIACRLSKYCLQFMLLNRTVEPPKPYLLIDFSETLGINVYVLGAVFLQLCQLLSLGEHNIIKRPVDPTLFIPRFTEKLLDGRNIEVSRTAMHIIASMKRDWMQTGRKPSGLCGAALYISALSHGFKFSKSDIVKIVHICEVTLTKRLIEFENTDSGKLTIEELNKNALELKKSTLSSSGFEKSGEILCEHKDSGQPPFAHGLCRSCFEDFIELSGGLDGGSDPPAFQHAEKIRTAEESAKKLDESVDDVLPQNERETTDHMSETNVRSSAETGQNMTKNERFVETAELQSNTYFVSVSTIGDRMTVDGASDTCPKFNDTSTFTSDESDGLSDIDDLEVSGYLNNEEETRFKKIIWEEMNREYLEEQAAAAAAKMENGEANSKSSTAKSRKERRKKQDSNENPAQTAAEAARQMLSKKRFSSKINYDALEKCFSDDPPPPNKKPNLSSHDDEATTQSVGGKQHDLGTVDNEKELDEEYEDMEEYDIGPNDHEYLEEDVYDYGYDDGDEEY